MNQVALTDVAAALWSRVVKGTRIVGIDGPSGSGKTSLARQLVDQSAATLVEIDDFVSWTDFAGWWPRFNDQVLKPLLLGNDAHYQVRDWQHDPMGSSLNGWKTARWSPLIILEGVRARDEPLLTILPFEFGSRHQRRFGLHAVLRVMVMRRGTYGSSGCESNKSFS